MWELKTLILLNKSAALPIIKELAESRNPMDITLASGWISFIA